MKIVKGGSLGNGMALKGGSDASLVVFLSTLQGSAAQERGEEDVIQKIEEGLGQCSVQEPAEVDIHPNLVQGRARKTVNGMKDILKE
ncbi:2'-5'-oligoadenylate synthase 1-like [Elgaria multicarinata webbii]|uniref:2'-5'-oligoadenylate synthase 1-like n=1 Tax=Elgaria multicarinata webbii TaxID=159646 RepID=UPI002FCD4446